MNRTRIERWTVTHLSSLPPRPSPYTDPAEANHQFLVRKRKDGTSRTFFFRGKLKGTEVRLIIGHFPETSLAQSRDEVRQLRELASRGIDPRRGRSKRRGAVAASAVPADGSDEHSVEYLVSEFTARYLRPTRKRPEYAEKILAREVLSNWANRDARAIEPHDVLDLLDAIVERGSKVMANRTAALLTQLFKFGIHRRIVSSNPVQLLFRPGGKEKPRQRSLSDDELRAFLVDPTACTRFERLAHVIQVLLLTGQRRGELALARWSHVDFASKTWTVPDENSKNGRGHIVPLTDWAVKEFTALKNLAEKSRWVLPDSDPKKPLDPKQLTRGVAKCQERFQKRGIKAFTLHDLRRTCRTGLSRLKVEPHIAERVLNHAQDKIAGTYDLFEYLDEKRAALEKWATHLKGLAP